MMKSLVFATLSNFKNESEEFFSMVYPSNPEMLSKRSVLLIEGFAIYKYILGAKPNLVFVKKYVRCIESLRLGVPLGVPKLFIVFPSMLSMLDRSGFEYILFNGDLHWRINAASFICESSPFGARAYLGINQKQSMIFNLCGLLRAGFFEIVVRVACVVSYFPIYFFLASRK